MSENVTRIQRLLKVTKTQPFGDKVWDHCGLKITCDVFFNTGCRPSEFIFRDSSFFFSEKMRIAWKARKFPPPVSNPELYIPSLKLTVRT